MKVEVFICDSCKKAIEANDGFIIRGNIHVIDYVDDGGVVGDNFSDDGLLANETHFCRGCFKRICLKQTEKTPQNLNVYDEIKRKYEEMNNGRR